MPRPIIRELGGLTTDPDFFYGWLDYTENPDPILRYESNGKGITFYDEIDRDDRAGPVLEARYEAVAGEDYEIVPGGKTARHKKIAEFVESNLRAINLPSATKDILQAILYGYYGVEVIWIQKGAGSLVKIKQLIGKHPRRLLFDAERNVRLRTRKNSLHGEPVPDDKFIILSFGDTENPYGKGLGRRLWWPVWFKKNGIKFWSIFLEKFGSPTVVGEYPIGADDDQIKEIERATMLVQQKTGVVIPEGFALKLLEATRTGNASYEAMVQRMDTAISITIFKQNLTTEVKGGSRAASETHDSVAHRTSKMDAKLVEDVYNETMIRDLVDWNFSGVKEEDYPKIRYIMEKEAVQKTDAETDEILLTKIGLNLDPAWLAEKYNVKTDGSPRLGQPEGGKPAAFAEKAPQQTVDNQEQIDKLTDRAIAKVDLAENEQIILDLIRKSSSYEEVYAGLADLYDTLSMEDLGKVMKDALLIAYASGVESVEKQVEKAVKDA